MYELTIEIPSRWDVEERGMPFLILKNEYGGQSVIAMDDHCLVLYNGSEDRDFKPVTHWYKEAVEAVIKTLKDRPDFIETWMTH